MESESFKFALFPAILRGRFLKGLRATILGRSVCQHGFNRVCRFWAVKSDSGGFPVFLGSTSVS